MKVRYNLEMEQELREKVEDKLAEQRKVRGDFGYSLSQLIIELLTNACSTNKK